MSYAGSCHCGAVTFEVAGDPPGTAMSCNCSHCRRKGFLLAFVPGDTVTIRGEERLGAYTFNKHAISHRFCTTCGCQPFSVGADPTGAAVVALNLRCVPTIDLATLAIQEIDGASL